MDQKHAPTVVIIVTVMVALTCYLLNDNSGIAVTDLRLENGENDTCQVTHNLLLGKTFNDLEVSYVLYNSKNQTMANHSTKITNTSVWSIPVRQEIRITEKTEDKTPKKMQITVYELNQNKTGQERIYNKNYTFDY